jgi:hypothetical protein
LWPAAYLVYAELFHASERLWLQFVVKVRVRPSCCKYQGNTLGRSHFDPDVLVDPNFPDGVW